MENTLNKDCNDAFRAEAFLKNKLIDIANALCNNPTLQQNNINFSCAELLADATLTNEADLLSLCNPDATNSVIDKMVNKLLDVVLVNTYNDVIRQQVYTDIYNAIIAKDEAPPTEPVKQTESKSCPNYFRCPNGRFINLAVSNTADLINLLKFPSNSKLYNQDGYIYGFTIQGMEYMVDVRPSIPTQLLMIKEQNGKKYYKPNIYAPSDPLVNREPARPFDFNYLVYSLNANGCGVIDVYKATVLADGTIDRANKTLIGRLVATDCEDVETVNISGNTFKISRKNGEITKVEGTWQTFGKCDACPAEAEKALQNALNKAKAKYGKLTDSTPIVEGITQPYGDAGSIVYTEMKLMDILKNLSKTYNSLVDKAKVPEAVWQPQEDLPAEDKDFFVQDKTGVISGALDQGLEELREIPELVGMGLSVVSDPKGAYNQLQSFAQQMDWQKAKTMVKEVVRGAVFADEFDKGGIYALHGTGRAGVVVAKAGLTGGGILLMIRKTGVDLLALLSKIRKKLQDLNWSDIEIARFADDLGTAEGILKAFDNDLLDFEASKALVLGNSGVTGKNLRRVKENLEALTKVKKMLPSDGSITMDDIKGAILKSDSKQSFLDGLGSLDESDLDGLKAYLEKKGSYKSIATELLNTTLTDVKDAITTGFASARQAARQAAANLDINSPTYKTDLKAKMQEVIANSEKAAEAMADVHFGKANEIDLSLGTLGKQGQFDRVYKNADGSFSVVECKGGASPLGSRQNYEQCTKQYIESIIANLRKNLPSDSPKLKDLNDLNDALNSPIPKVKSYSLRQKFNDDGSLGNTIKTEFSL